MNLSAHHLAGLLEALEQTSQCVTLESFGRCVARELHRLIPGLSASYNEVNTHAHRAFAAIHPEPDDAWWEEFTPPFSRYMGQHPVLDEFTRTGSTKPLTWDDVDPTGNFFTTELFRNFYEPNRIRSQLLCRVPAAHGVLVGLAVNRDGTGFSDVERELMSLFHDHLVNLHRLVSLADRARLSIEVLGLTPRQAEVALLIGEDLTNRQIASRLGIGEGTVRKHLGAIFSALGVQSRAGAVAALLSYRPSY